MIYREMIPAGTALPDGTVYDRDLVLIRSALRVELQDLEGNTVKGWDPTAQEAQAHAAWEAGRTTGSVPDRIRRAVQQVFRDAVSGEFVTAEYAAANPATTIRETIRKALGK